MRPHCTLWILAGFCSTIGLCLRPRTYETHDYYALHLDASIPPAEVAQTLGLVHEGPLGELQDHHLFSALRHEDDVVRRALSLRKQKKRRWSNDHTDRVLDGVLFAQKQKIKPRHHKRVVTTPPALESRETSAQGEDDSHPVDSSVTAQRELAKTLNINDPIFLEQWHLYNPVQLGHDVNVTGVWLAGNTGHNATVAIVDDGLDMYSDDLKPNYFPEGSYDFNDHTDEPKPRLSDDRHGTRCAGEVSAAKNDVCGVGVAWDSRIAGIRILSADITDADEAIAMNYAFQDNQIYSCSWGPPDDGRAMAAPGILIKRAMVNAVQNGRDGRGSVYVFASGNGAASDDNCNFDGYTNSIYSITVGAIDRKGLHPYYAEKCCAQLVVTYSSGSGDAIHTTDVGTNQCYSGHGGTSAAAPLAAGIFALVLSERPDLNWRDMQYLAMNTAVPINEADGEWQTTTIGKKYSHTYGYGKIDAWAIVEAAKDWESVKPQAWYNSPWMHVKHAIPQGDQGLASTFEVTADSLKSANLERLEHVQVTMNVDHTKRGDLSVELESPDGIISHLSATRRLDASSAGYVDWTFMSVVHWGESGIGTWTVTVKDTNVNEHNGTFVDWKLTLWGECIDPSIQSLHPLPTEHDDDDHDIIVSAPAATKSISLAPTPTALPAVTPTDLPDRPIFSKPGEAEVLPTETAEPTEAATSNPDNLLPGIFPTFGVSKRTQIWIYGALCLIILFCVGLGVYLYMARRKRLRNLHDDYEFEVLDDLDDVDGTNGTAGTRKGKRRAGELYDAFAGESDEELFSEDDEPPRYQDEDPDDLEDEKDTHSPNGANNGKERLLGSQ